MGLAGEEKTVKKMVTNMIKIMLVWDNVNCRTNGQSLGCDTDGCLIFFLKIFHSHLGLGGVHWCEVAKPLRELFIDATHRLGRGNTRVTKAILSHKTKKKIAC